MREAGSGNGYGYVKIIPDFTVDWPHMHGWQLLHGHRLYFLGGTAEAWLICLLFLYNGCTTHAFSDGGTAYA
jgi:hypothetical protein